jgi:hypothetical protein
MTREEPSLETLRLQNIEMMDKVQRIDRSTMDIVKYTKQGKYLNSLEKCHIFLISIWNLHVNDTNIDCNNVIFKTLYQNSSTCPPSKIQISPQ